MEPVGIQSVPSAMLTPTRCAIDTRAVSPYSVMLLRGLQIMLVPAPAIWL